MHAHATHTHTRAQTHRAGPAQTVPAQFSIPKSFIRSFVYSFILLTVQSQRAASNWRKPA
jgi:hypothetical protein